MTDAFQKTREAVVAALNDPKVTLGTAVEYVHPMTVLGNLSRIDPALSMVAIDDFGRLWKEYHREGTSELVCVFDFRSLTPRLFKGRAA